MLNWRELEKILSELPLEGSYIQKTTEHSTHSFTLHMYSKEEKAYLLYFEVGTKNNRVCRTNKIREKNKVTQRFGQYLRSHLVGKKIISVEQLPFDRAFILTLQGQDERLLMLTRLFSGSKANIFILSEDSVILEAMYRRTIRGERIGDKIFIERRVSEGDKTYSIRPWTGSSFNEYIDKEEEKEQIDDRVERAKASLEIKMEREINAIKSSISNTQKRIQNTSSYSTYKTMGDTLRSNLHLAHKGMESITIDGISIPLDKRLSPSENLERLYSTYKKDKRTYLVALNELESLNNELKSKEEYYSNLLNGETSYKALERAKDEGKREEKKYPGVRVISHKTEIYAGRNAEENEEILRKISKPYDIWMHTRDYQGGYVIIKRQRDKSVPLEVLLDAASVAIFFSKARKAKGADLYYTEVKYLRHPKDGKKGLIIPTQEKNIRVTLDERRVKELLGKYYEEP